MDIGMNIRKIRELKGFSQEFMAQKLEISQRQYSRIENNDTEIAVTRLEAISQVLEVTPQQLLGFDEKFIFQNCENAFGTNQNYYAFSEKEREQYEKRIAHLEGEILFLREMVGSK
jgi:transcriptional regulator with XRE-family HTH domain